MTDNIRLEMTNKIRLESLWVEVDELDIDHELAAVVLEDPRFPVWSGSGKPEHHHFGKGGLLRHTYEVGMLCMEQRRLFQLWGCDDLNPKVLFLAALYHDIGKTFDYEPTSKRMTNWRKAKHAREVHHISRSAIIWSQAVASTGRGRDIESAVLHCILSHHGQREWGSPVAPASKEAWMLHLCDGISARMDDCNRIDMVKLDKKGGD